MLRYMYSSMKLLQHPAQQGTIAHEVACPAKSRIRIKTRRSVNMQDLLQLMENQTRQVMECVRPPRSQKIRPPRSQNVLDLLDHRMCQTSYRSQNVLDLLGHGKLDLLGHRMCQTSQVMENQTSQVIECVRYSRLWNVLDLLDHRMCQTSSVMECVRPPRSWKDQFFFL